jgi:hypothetical protein
MQWKEILVEYKMMMDVCIIHPLICWFTYVKIVKVKPNAIESRRKSDCFFFFVEDILCDINLGDIPENLIKRFDYEK